MAISNASRLADFGTGIGTEGAAIQIDNVNQRVGIGTTNPQGTLQVGTGVTIYGNSGIVSATSFYGDGSNLSAVIADSATTATYASTSGIATYASTSGIATYAETAGIATNAQGLTGTPNITVGIITASSGEFSGNVSIAGTLTYEDVTNVDSIGLITARSGIIVTSGISTFKGADFNGGSPLKEKVNITAGKLSDNLNINLDNGMVHFFTTTETTTSTPKIYSSVGINTQMAIGDASTVTIITTAPAAGYSTAINIDGLYNDVEWSGGTDPATGGASGKDVYALQIIKTGIGTFTVLGALNNFA